MFLASRHTGPYLTFLTCFLIPNWVKIYLWKRYILTVPPEAVEITGYGTGTPLSLGQAFSLNCKTCKGNPPPLLTWTELTLQEELDSSFNADENGCTNVSISLGPMTKEFNGKKYECHAVNGINPERRGSRILTVHCNPLGNYSE